MNTLKVGDKVKIRSDLVVGNTYYRWDTPYGLCLTSAAIKYLWKEMVIWSIDNDWDFTLVWDEDKLFWTASMFDPIQSSTVTSRQTYQRKAERSDGVMFEKDAIWGRSLKEIQDSIKERKDSIKADEQLLRAHRSLFSKK